VNEIGLALVGLIVTAIGIAVTGVITLGPLLVQRQRLKLEHEVAALKREVADVSVAAIEERARTTPALKGDAKVQAALALAATEQRRVTLSPADMHAGVTRLRASLPNPSMLPPLSIPVQLVSSEPPAPLEAVERPTIPRPGRVPDFESANTTRPLPGRKP
jgi:hypothetical protein